MKCFLCDTNASYRSIYNIPANETTRHSFVGLSHLWPKKKEKDVPIKLSFNNVSQTQASPCFPPFGPLCRLIYEEQLINVD